MWYNTFIRHCRDFDSQLLLPYWHRCLLSLFALALLVLSFLAPPALSFLFLPWLSLLCGALSLERVLLRWGIPLAKRAAYRLRICVHPGNTSTHQRYCK